MNFETWQSSSNGVAGGVHTEFEYNSRRWSLKLDPDEEIRGQQTQKLQLDGLVNPVFAMPVSRVRQGSISSKDWSSTYRQERVLCHRSKAEKCEADVLFGETQQE